MSFAAAAFDSRGTDVVLGADSRWCEILDDDSFIPRYEDAIKCRRLRCDIGLAFTGLFGCFRSMLAGLYRDSNLAQMRPKELREAIGERDIPSDVNRPGFSGGFMA